jgi:basic membrane protein A
MHCSGDKTAENLGTYFGRIHDPKYLSGIIAGSMTKSNIIGYVAPFDHIPEVVRGIIAFALGVRSVNPKAEVRVKLTKSWYDEGVERKSAETLADEGADVLSMQQDSPETLKVAEERGKYAIGYNSDMKRFAPNAYLTSPIWNWGIVYKDIAEKVHQGTWKSEDIWWGMDKELVGLAPLSDKVPADVKKMVEEKKAEIISGKFHVFTGHIRDEKGNLIVSEGKVMTDAELLQMKFFVEGVKR